MSRAFVKDDDSEPPAGRFGLPPVDDPAFPTAAALALLESAMEGDIASAERATGCRWGDPDLKPRVEELVERERQLPEHQQDERFLRAAKRFLRAG
jgi:hypothetical protein